MSVMAPGDVIKVVAEVIKKEGKRVQRVLR